MRTDSRLSVGSPTARAMAIMVATLLAAVMIVGAGIAGSRLLAADAIITVAQDGSGDHASIGEAVDVTGWLGGYNFQWAWSSGWCAGQYA